MLRNGKSVQQKEQLCKCNDKAQKACKQCFGLTAKINPSKPKIRQESGSPLKALG